MLFSRLNGKSQLTDKSYKCLLCAAPICESAAYRTMVERVMFISSYRMITGKTPLVLRRLALLPMGFNRTDEVLKP